jgi:hypothetical protein
MERKLIANYLVPEDEVWVSPATWERPFSLKAKESQHTTVNTGSPKLLCELEECVRLLDINLEYNRGAVTEKLNAVIAQLRAGA